MVYEKGTFSVKNGILFKASPYKVLLSTPSLPLVKNTFALQMIVFIKAYFLFFKVVLTLGVYLSKAVCDNSDRDVHFVISVLDTCMKR